MPFILCHHYGLTAPFHLVQVNSAVFSADCNWIIAGDGSVATDFEHRPQPKSPRIVTLAASLTETEEPSATRGASQALTN